MHPNLLLLRKTLVHGQWILASDGVYIWFFIYNICKFFYIYKYIQTNVYANNQRLKVSRNLHMNFENVLYSVWSKRQ